MKIINSKKAVTEILGTFILLMIAISLFTLVNFVVIMYPFSESVPSVNLVGAINQDGHIVIKHNYGDKLSLETEIIVRIGSGSHNVIASDYSPDSSGDNYWGIGESFVIDPSAAPISSDPIAASDYVGITVVDIESNSVIMMADLQKGTI